MQKVDSFPQTTLKNHGRSYPNNSLIPHAIESVRWVGQEHSEDLQVGPDPENVGLIRHASGSVKICSINLMTNQGAETKFRGGRQEDPC